MNQHSRSKRKRPRQKESPEQRTLFAWASLASNKHPELNLMYAVPNGGRRVATERLIRGKLRRVSYEAGKLKAEGVKAGIPDIMLPVARGGYFGLYIEMKMGDNKPTIEQRWWLLQLDNQGYKTEVCYGYEKAKEVIEDYLKEQSTIKYMTDRRKNQYESREPERRNRQGQGPYSNKAGVYTPRPRAAYNA